ncbi:hypothetical protein DA2_2914 [Desulfovibrio sp. A2]|nr:hypothetical protein DA2_2914 [Desulfovibrio sp. A2]
MAQARAARHGVAGRGGRAGGSPPGNAKGRPRRDGPESRENDGSA